MVLEKRLFFIINMKELFSLFCTYSTTYYIIEGLVLLLRLWRGLVFTPHNLGWGDLGIIFTDSGLVSPPPPSPGITLLRTVHTAPGRYRVEVIYRGNQRGSSMLYCVHCTLYCVQWSAVVY